ncbi:MAG: hypothetical protein U1G07_12170 [Verrucomicrobiota bacterium]
MTSSSLPGMGMGTDADIARSIQASIPPAGLFAGQRWRISPEPFPLPRKIVAELDSLGRVLVAFYRAVGLLYRRSVAGQEPPWVAQWLDQGKPADLRDWQRAPNLKNEIPRVIRPDLLLLDDGLVITELDSVPGGIGLTAWLNQVYARVPLTSGPAKLPTPLDPSAAAGDSRLTSRAIVGGADGMLRGFEAIFGQASRVHIVVSEESSTYRPEMEWLAGQLGPRFRVQSASFSDFEKGDAVYRFFELFDLGNVKNAGRIMEMALAGDITLTPPPKPIFEEKMLFALLWNRNLRGFWRRELGQGFLDRLWRLVPYTWLIDPAPLPPHAAIPELNLTDWQQLKALSQRERDLILKVSGFAETAWGARGVYLGSDLPLPDWSAAVDLALREFERSPFVLQRYHKPTVVQTRWFDFDAEEVNPMNGRVRLCPFYFVNGEGDAARARLGGVLATICPADKKIIHGMTEAILAPCSYEQP